jgi:hypothetical protein
VHGRRSSRRILSVAGTTVVAVVMIGHTALGATGGSQLWVARYAGVGGGAGSDVARAITYSPDSAKTFVTGVSAGIGGEDYATIAYNSSSGAVLWSARYDGAGGEDDAYDLVASPTTSTVFVTGYSDGAASEDYVTIAYDSTTGAQRWLARYDGPGAADDEAVGMVASPDGSKVFVTGYSDGTTGSDYATVAYNATNGAQLWVSRYDGPGHGSDEAYSVAVTPDGTRLFVTGVSAGATSGLDYATVSLNAATGAPKWSARFDGSRGLADYAQSVVSSPDGAKVYVTGYSPSATNGQDYVTLAYSAANGSTLWSARFNGSGNESDYGREVAVSPDGARVFVTGTSWADVTGRDYATVAYNAATGSRLWTQRFSSAGERSDYGRAIAPSRDGSKVFVTGASYGGTTGPDYVTIAYDASTGATAWTSRYNGPKSGADSAYAIAASPDGTRLAVTGVSPGSATGQDFASVSYAP